MNSSSGGAGPQMPRPIVGLAHKCPVQLRGRRAHQGHQVRQVRQALLRPSGPGETRLDELDGLDALDGRGLCFRMGLGNNGGAGPQMPRPLQWGCFTNNGAAVGPIKAIKFIKSVKFVKPSSGLLARAKRGLTNLTDLTPLTAGGCALGWV